MRPRTLLLLAVLLLMTTVFYASDFRNFRSISATYINSIIGIELLPQRRTESFEEVEVDAKGLSPRQALEDLRNRYRLQVDRRFIMAIGYLYQVTGHNIEQPVTTKFINGQWHVFLDERIIGKLAELPTFEEGIALLRKVAKQTLKHLRWTDNKTLSIMSSPDGFSPVQLQRHLQTLDVIWKTDGATTKLLIEAATSQTKLAWASHFINPENDTTTAKALALLALAQAASQTPLYLQESMLAASSGYHTHADKLLPQLYVFDAWRLYREERDNSLHALASLSKAGRDAIDLWLTRLAFENRVDEWKDWFISHDQLEEPPLYPMQTALFLTGQSPQITARYLMPAAILASARAKPVGGKFITQSLFATGNESRDELLQKAITSFYLRLKQSYDISTNSLSQILGTRSDEMTGPLLSDTDFIAFYQELYNASLQRLGLYYLDLRGSMKESSLFSAILPGDGQPVVSEISHWYMNLVNANNYKAEKNALYADLTTTSYLNVSMLLRTFEELAPLYEYGSPLRRQAATHVIKRMDSRINHRHEVIGLAREHLLHFSLSEKLADSIRQQEPLNSYNLTSWLGHYYNDRDLLSTVVNDNKAPTYARSNALVHLAELDKADPSLQLHHIDLVNAKPLDWDIRENYIGYLKSLHEYDRAINVATSWMLLTDSQTNPFDRWKATIAVSEIQLLRGEKQKAWDSISTITDFMYGPALAQACRIKIEQGDLEAATQWAVRAAKRYPNSPKHITNLLEVLWRNGEDDTAAQIFSKLLQRFSPTDLRFKFAKQFAAVFKGDSQRAREAVAALATTGLDYKTLMYIPMGFEKQEDYQRAFEIQSRLRTSGFDQLASYTAAYRYLEKWQGYEAAYHWLKERIPTRYQNAASMLYFTDKHYSLLWSMIENPGADRFPDAIWLYRAAAYVDGATLTPTQHSALMDYYRGSGNSKYDRIGKYLMGLSNDSDLIDLVMDKRSLSETAFYLALKAKQSNDYKNMAEWFLISIEVSTPTNGEYRWSYNRLYAWYTKGHSLAVLLENEKH